MSEDVPIEESKIPEEAEYKGIVFPKFPPGAQVVFTKTNPGYMGMVVGLFPGYCYFNMIVGNNVEYREESMRIWKEKIGVSENEILRHFVYMIQMDRPVLPCAKPNIKEGTEVDPEYFERKLHFLWVSELELVSYDEYWNKIEGQVGAIE